MNQLGTEVLGPFAAPGLASASQHDIIDNYFGKTDIRSTILSTNHHLTEASMWPEHVGKSEGEYH